MRIVTSPKGRRYFMLRMGVGVCYAEKNGMACLKWNTSWRKINGVWVNTRWGCFWFLFRRTKLRW